VLVLYLMMAELLIHRIDIGFRGWVRGLVGGDTNQGGGLICGNTNRGGGTIE